MFKLITAFVGVFILSGLFIFLVVYNSGGDNDVPPKDECNVFCEEYVAGYTEGDDSLKDEAICTWGLLVEEAGGELSILGASVSMTASEYEAYSLDLILASLINHADEYADCLEL
ncbi:hypothetical protein LCGC14_3129140 [marine sediment metagenome]|uniref:Uncharacterized protein n=1 Tax=marine sediment metagenome TaxID=412755 RepID=A0A0F8YPN3_9ZZZZ|nr:hypothetical protein [bacterium]